jgi:putative flippase GtrA
MVSNEKKRNLIREHKTDIILFGLSGLMAFTADYTALLLTERISHNLLAATTMGILAGFIVSYILNALRFKKRHSETRPLSRSLPLFIILFIINTVFTFICLEFNERHSIAPRLIVKMGTVGFIMIWNYILFHSIIFRSQSFDNH